MSAGTSKPRSGQGQKEATPNANAPSSPPASQDQSIGYGQTMVSGSAELPSQATFATETAARPPQFAPPPPALDTPPQSGRTRPGGSRGARPSQEPTLVRADTPPPQLEITPQVSAPPAARRTERSGTTDLGLDWLRPGAAVQHYEFIRELGRGGMGSVWLARDTTLGRRVAIKVMTLDHDAPHERFMIEARATAQCQHENIVVIHEVMEHENTPLMVLEYLNGAPLAAHIEEVVSPQRAVSLVLPVVRALQVAHDLGIAHRDLKPDNIFVTDDGLVKVLDFGIAKLMGQETDSMRAPGLKLDATALREVYSTVSSDGIVGTLPYMSPEQWGIQGVDQRTDFWALGIMLHKMVTGRHPVDPITRDSMVQMVLAYETPIPSVQALRPDLPDQLVHVIDRCLRKDADERYQNAEELISDLNALAPGGPRSHQNRDSNPYPGLSAFQERDAARFFGRERDISRAYRHLQSAPLLAVVGASGVGKSSFIRAGLFPALKAEREWESLVLRPGRSPFDSLASMLVPLLGTDAPASNDQRELTRRHEETARRLRTEPGYLGSALRARALQRGARYVIFVDQFEELYTLVENLDERLAFTAALSGAADDHASPIRLVLSMRSDLLDRVAEDRKFQADIVRNIQLLARPGSTGLRRALTEPLALTGFSFEDASIVDEMVEAIQHSEGSLPLLQFAAARLWDQRERQAKLLTRDAYDAMGGISGALASHADEVLRSMSRPHQSLARTILTRLVTPERTRAIVDTEDLTVLGDHPSDANLLLRHLATARLVVVQNATDSLKGSTAEIVHESLISGWPTLTRWLDESQEDAHFLAQLSVVAQQWDARERKRGLLWRGDAAEEAERFQGRFAGRLAPRESAFLEASTQLAHRSKRIKRGAVLAAFFTLSLLVGAGAIALVTIQEAEQTARANAESAEQEKSRAQLAERTVSKQLTVIQAKDAARLRAEDEALRAIRAADLTREELESAYAKLRVQLLALKEKEAARLAAEQRASAANSARSEAEEATAAAEERADNAERSGARRLRLAELTREELEEAYLRAQAALSTATTASQEASAAQLRAESAAREERAKLREAQAAHSKTQSLLSQEQAKNARLRSNQSKIATELR